MTTDTTSAFLGNSAAPRTLEHGGNTYRFRRLDQAMMEAYSEWLISTERKRLVTLYGHDQALLAAKLLELEKDVRSGAYEFTEELVLGREAWRKETRTIDGTQVEGEVRIVEGGVIHTKHGRVALVATLLACDRVEVIRLMAARPAEVAHLLSLTLSESIGAGTGDPRDTWRPLGNGSPAQQAAPRP